MSPAATALARTFAHAFAQLSDLAKTEPGEAVLLGQHISAHLRSLLPSSSLLDTGPVALLEPEPEPEKAP